VLAQRTAAAAGLGLILLTPYVARQGNDLVCVFPDQPLMTRGLWIAAPEDLLKIRRYRFVWDHIRQLIEQHPDLFRRPS
jgi:DNA-binding transcriptional LysR family regulator